MQCIFVFRFNVRLVVSFLLVLWKKNSIFQWISFHPSLDFDWRTWACPCKDCVGISGQVTRCKSLLATSRLAYPLTTIAPYRLAINKLQSSVAISKLLPARRFSNVSGDIKRGGWKEKTGLSLYLLLRCFFRKTNFQFKKIMSNSAFKFNQNCVFNVIEKTTCLLRWIKLVTLIKHLPHVYKHTFFRHSCEIISIELSNFEGIDKLPPEFFPHNKRTGTVFAHNAFSLASVIIITILF